MAIISHCVWLYFRFALSYREVQEMMAERGVVVSHETIRTWGEKFGREYARRLRRQRGRLGDTWHLDEVFVRIGGCQKYLWRAVDQEGNVLDIYDLFNVGRHRLKAKHFRILLARRFETWRYVTGVAPTAA